MKILFISHDASRTGAPILLLRLIEAIKAFSNIEFIILLRNGGELADKFNALGKTFIWDTTSPKNRTVYYSSKLLRKIGIDFKSPKIVYNQRLLGEMKNITIIFNNTITNATILRQLPLDGKKVFHYFHEMQVITEVMATPDDISYLSKLSKKIFVPSNVLATFLHIDYQIPEEKFAILPYIIPKKERVSANTLASHSLLDKELTGGKFLIGLSGTLHWRKGYELLPLLARTLVSEKAVPDIHFVWIGANKHSLEYVILKNDLKKLGLWNFFTFIEPVENINGYLEAVDILALPSREDAFPLVVLEAAVLGKPAICFRQAGGIVDFVAEDAGVLVDYLDVEQMADAIINLKNNPVYKKSLGQKAREKALAYSNEKNVIDVFLHHLIN